MRLNIAGTYLPNCAEYELPTYLLFYHCSLRNTNQLIEICECIFQ